MSTPGLTPAEVMGHYIPAQRKLLIVESSLVSVAFIVVCSRVYVRAYMLRNFRTDDWLMLIAQVLNTVAAISFARQVYYGAGRRSSEIPGKLFPPQLQWTFTYFIFSMSTLGIVKISVCFNLKRITQAKYYRYILTTLSWSLAISTFAQVSLIVVTCVPVAAFWDYSLRPPPIGHGEASCISTSVINKVNIGMSSFVLLTDVILALLPVPIIWNLQITTRMKMSLSVVLGLSIIACIGGTFKLYQQSFLNNFDTTYNHMLEWYTWQFVETNIAVIAASLPTIQPLLRGFLQLFFLKKTPDSKKPLSGTNFVQLKEVPSADTTNLTIHVIKTVEQYRSPMPGHVLRRLSV